MKKTITILSAIAIFFIASSFTNKGPENTNETVNAVFKTNFAGADEVSWKEIDGFYFVDFTLNGRNMGAAYDADGQQLLTSRLVTRDEVPANLLKRAEGNYRNGRSGTYVLELTYKGETSYYFDIITDRFAIRCMADADGVITEDERMKLQK